MDAPCSRVYINKMKDILTLSPRILGVPTKLLGAQSNTLLHMKNMDTIVPLHSTLSKQLSNLIHLMKDMVAAEEMNILSHISNMIAERIANTHHYINLKKANWILDCIGDKLKFRV